MTASSYIFLTNEKTEVKKTGEKEGRGHKYGKRMFLFSCNVCPSCCVTRPQFCHNAWWCWRNMQ